MKKTDVTLTMKVVRGQNTRSSSQSIWQRFDRLQRSVAPLRKGQRITRGIHYLKAP